MRAAADVDRRVQRRDTRQSSGVQIGLSSRSMGQVEMTVDDGHYQRRELICVGLAMAAPPSSNARTASL